MTIREQVIATTLNGERGRSFETHIPGDVDAVFRSLADPLRREMLYRLVEWDDERISAERLARALAAGDTARSPDGIEALLVHVHLPHLAARGFVEYDDSESVVWQETDALLTELLAIASQIER